MSTTQYSPSGMKTHHYGIILQMIIAIVMGIQSGMGQTIDLTDPAIWSEVVAIIWTIWGLKRNLPQGSTTVQPQAPKTE